MEQARMHLTTFYIIRPKPKLPKEINDLFVRTISKCSRFSKSDYITILK